MAGESQTELFEAEIFTDARLLGQELAAGPYRIFSSVGSPFATRVEPKLVLRATYHRDPENLPVEEYARTYTEHYVAGDLTDQLATLLALALGARFKGSEANRVWWGDDPDPLGRPVRFGARTPYLNFPDHASLLPDVVNIQVTIAEASEYLNKVPSLTAIQATALLRAARLYRQALWIADDDPELAWLLLVSALEVAANEWHRSSAPAVDLLEASKPGLAKMLRDGGGKDLLVRVAPELVKVTQATKKFLDFISEFATEPPVNRPAMWARVDWTKIKRVAAVIYNHRSDVLHEGQPMPYPLLLAPRKDDQDVYEERPSGLGHASGTSTWSPNDVPIHLHIFAGMTRRALLAWWHQLIPAT